MSSINAVERQFTPDFLIEQPQSPKDRLERLMSLINAVERYFKPYSPIKLK